MQNAINNISLSRCKHRNSTRGSATFENIREIAEQIAEQNNLFLVDFIVRGSEFSRVIEVFIDGEINVSADECALDSREICKHIDEKELLKTYRLDVSSPGVDRPLIYLQQFSKHMNRLFEIEFSAKGGSASGGDAYNLSSGIYFYKLNAVEYSETKKMILLK